MSLPALPETKRVRGRLHRIISTCYPPIDFFERHVPPALMGALWALEADTNPRLLQETGDLNLVREEDRVSGAGASIIMASFTYIGHASRFSSGTYGVYYASRKLETAIRETVHHREIIYQDATLPAENFSMRVWNNEIAKPLLDVRESEFDVLHDDDARPENHSAAHAFGVMAKDSDAWGIIYRSVRHDGGECVAALRPPAITPPTQGAHLVYVWDGSKITEVFERSEPIISF